METLMFVGFALALVGLVINIAAVCRRRKLRPQECVCGHGNHVHREGKGTCLVGYGVTEKYPNGSSCACDVFIEKPVPPKLPKDQSTRELEKMVGL